MKKVVIFFLLLLPLATFAHLPVIEDDAGEGIQTIPDPTLQSIASYGSISLPGEVDSFTFTVSKDEVLPIEVLVPVRVSNQDFHPTIAISKNPVSKDSVANNAEVIYVKPPELDTRTTFFEPFSQELLYRGNEYKLEARTGDTYYLYLFDEGGKTGDYSLGVGTVENFQNQDTLSVLKTVGLIKLGLVGGREVNMSEVIGLFVLLFGFIIGLGAVTVIDLHGFLGRHSSYWTQATTRTHKVTKPLIWVGMLGVIFGACLLYRDVGWTGLAPVQSLIILILLLNGAFLSFYVSPKLIQREKEGRDTELLPKSMQRKIFFSFIVSFLGWWLLLASFVWYLLVLR